MSSEVNSEMSGKNKTAKRLTLSMIAVILLFLCLCFTTYALVRVGVSVENNTFYTGTVQINLNDGNPVIEEHEFIFEPGMIVKKDFFIENQSTWDVYYKVYFENVEGDLADVLEISIQDGEKVLFAGTAKNLSRENVGAADDVLGVNERRNLTVYFYFPKEAGNRVQKKEISFQISADAVQTKNNPNGDFE